MEPPNKGHVGTWSFVLYREVSFIRRLECTGIIGFGTSRFVLYREVFFVWSVHYRRFHCVWLEITSVRSYLCLYFLLIPIFLFSASQSTAGEESLRCCQELCEVYDVNFHHFNPLLPRLATLSVDVPLKDLVDSVMETIAQVVGRPLHQLLIDINNV